MTITRGLSATLLVLLLILARETAAQPAATIGANPPGSVLYAIGSGLAKVAGDAGTVKLAVQPYSGTSTFLPLLESGELELGLNNAVDVGLAFRGPSFTIGERNPFPHVPGIRLVMRVAPLMVAPVVRKDAPLKTVHDMKGKRVTGEYRANLAIWYNIFGELASAGLGWNDVKVVPVAALNDGIEALIQGRADVTSYALNGAKVREADAAVGVRHLSIDCSAEGERRLRAAVPGYYPHRVKKGEAVGVVDDICVVAYDFYVIAGKGASDPVIDGVLRATWERGDQLVQFHPSLRDWSRERMATSEATIPYHPAAVRFYRGRGTWTPALEQAQRRLTAATR